MAVGVITPQTPPKALRRPRRTPEPGADGAIDARVASHGGTRKNPRKGYEFAGMVDETSWRRGKVHAATSYYACALCGQRFKGPHAVYTHLAKRHDR